MHLNPLLLGLGSGEHILSIGSSANAAYPARQPNFVPQTPKNLHVPSYLRVGVIIKPARWPTRLNHNIFCLASFSSTVRLSKTLFGQENNGAIYSPG